MKYKELIKRLKQCGCKEIPRRGKGSHRKWFNPLNGKATIIPDWGSKDLKKATVRAIIKQLGLDIDLN